jgi:hypothetical protein
MAALAKERHFSDQKLGMIASMNLVTIQAVLGNRRMLEGIGPSLVGMAFVTKVVYRVGPDHRLNVRGAHRIMATRAFEGLSTDKGLIDR